MLDPTLAGQVASLLNNSGSSGLYKGVVVSLSTRRSTAVIRTAQDDNYVSVQNYCNLHVGAACYYIVHNNTAIAVAVEPSPWIDNTSGAYTLGASWVQTDMYIRRWSDQIQHRGAIRNSSGGSVGAGTTILTYSAPYRPPVDSRGLLVDNAGALITVNVAASTGIMSILSGTVVNNAFPNFAGFFMYTT